MDTVFDEQSLSGSGGSFARSGALSGASSVIVFTVIHHIFISNIWFSFVFMLAAGTVCGLSVAWTYGLLAPRATLAGWATYNLVFDGMFLVLAGASVILFEPITSMAVVVAASEPPRDLIAQAMPLSVFFTVAAAGIMHLLFGRGWTQFGALLLCWTLLMLLLGLNLSTLGLIHTPSAAWLLVVKFYGLILVLNSVFAATFMVLERESFHGGSGGHSNGERSP